MTTLSPAKLGPTQIHVLSVLKASSTGLTAPQIRDAAGLPEGDYGTRRAIAITGRLDELGFVVKEEMSEKVAAKHAHPITGRTSKHRFKITSEGKKALRSAS